MNDRNRTIIFVCVAALLFFAWPSIMKRLGWLPEAPPQETQNDSQAPSSTTAPSSTQPFATTGPAGTQPSMTAIAPSTGLRFVSAAESGNIYLGSEVPRDPTYALQVQLSPKGGGISRVLVNDYKQQIDTEQRFTFEQPYSDTSGSSPMSIRSLKVNGQELDLAPAVWHVADQGVDHATLTLDVVGENGVALQLVETFTVPPREDKDHPGAGGFDTKAKYDIRNTGTQPVAISAVLVGPTFPASEQIRGGDRQIVAGHRGRNAIVMQHDAVEALTKDKPTKEYAANSDNQPLAWIGGGGAYFTGIVRPLEDWMTKADAKLLNPDAEAGKHEVLLTLQTSEFRIEPKQNKELNARAFFGPRQRDLLHSAYYVGPGIEYQHVLEISGSCAFCTVQWIVNSLMWLLAAFHSVLRDWGLAIIALVLCVRGLLHPITKRSQINMAKMTKFGPELERIKKKFGDDKEGQQRAMMDFYKTHGATPVLGCLPMFLQMPIWIALYSGLSTTFELRQQPFFYGLTWIKDLAKPDHLIEFAPGKHLDFFFFHADGVNVIPMLLAIAFYVQFKLQPKAPVSTPEQEQQQKMMKWITTFMFPIMLYSMPSGLTLYILTSTVLGIIESKIIRKHILQQERLAGEGPTIIDAEIVGPPRQTPALAKKPGGIVGFFQRLQEQAEQMRQNTDKNGRPKKR